MKNTRTKRIETIYWLEHKRFFHMKKNAFLFGKRLCPRKKPLLEERTSIGFFGCHSLLEAAFLFLFLAFMELAFFS